MRSRYWESFSDGKEGNFLQQKEVARQPMILQHRYFLARTFICRAPRSALLIEKFAVKETYPVGIPH
jgi:hypothetical protein